jgi:glycosyltransferase involved in cell wall biosynthesis
LQRSRKIEIVYGYQGMCIKQFSQAKKLGLATVLELPNSLTKVQDGITELESLKFPSWNFKAELDCGREGIYAQEAMELELADWIVVPSQQVKDSIGGLCDDSKIVILPYSVSLKKPTRNILKSARTNRVLIVSRLISTKGIHYLEEATRGLDIDYELFIVGSLPNSPSTELLSFLKRNHYLGNMSRNRIVDLMQTCEIFILPSLIEGRSLSSLEAISQGLIPVLTPGTGAEDVVRENGILIPSRSSSAIREALLSLFTMKSSAKLDMRMRSLEIAESLPENVYLKTLDDFFSTLEMSRF